MPKRGRPRGLNINPTAVEDLLRERSLDRGEACERAGITPGHFADAMYRGKGASADLVNRLAGVLRCSPATIAPELQSIGTLRFVAVREDDLPVAAGQ